jgi:hypothetical protein
MTELEQTLSRWGRVVKQRSERRRRKTLGLAQPRDPYYCPPDIVAQARTEEARRFPEPRELEPTKLLKAPLEMPWDREFREVTKRLESVSAADFSKAKQLPLPLFVEAAE